MNIPDFANKARDACNTRGPATSLLRHCGIHPGVALVFVLSDWLLFGGELFTGMATLPISIIAGILLGIWAYKKQYRDYKDSKRLALLKGVLLAFVTAIPTPIGSLLPVIGVLLPFLDSFHSMPECDESAPTNNKEPEMKNVTPNKNKQ